MKKFILIVAFLALLAGGGWYLWQNQLTPASLFTSDPGYYTFGTINARIKVPDNWKYSTDVNREFAAFQSPDFVSADGSQDPFASSPIVQGAVIIIPLFLFEETTPLPVGKAVTLGSEQGDIAHGKTTSEGNAPATEYDRVRLHRDGVKYVLLALEYPPGFAGAEAILNDVVTSFEFQ